MIMQTFQVISQKIADNLQKGVFLNQETMQFIDSTFSSPSAEEIQAMINDPDSCEREGLIQLIFFPDESVQIQLEPFFEKHGLGQQDEKKILDHLKTLSGKIFIYLPHDRGSFSIGENKLSPDQTFLYDFALRHFISHLNCTQKLPQELSDAIVTHISDDYQWLTKVRLRNSRIDFTKKNILWLKALFKAFYHFEDIYEDILNFSLEFLDGASEKSDIYDQMSDLKILYFKALEKNRSFEAQMQKSNMETMIMQGKRSSGIDSRIARKKMALIDRISKALYGKTVHTDILISENDLGEVRTEADMKNIIQTLGT